MSEIETGPESPVRIRTEGKAGRITLNRPKSLNALDQTMIGLVDSALKAWADDPAVSLIIIEGAGDRAFCAGGDIKSLYHAASQGDFETGRRLWFDEYRLNRRIARYEKPIVSVVDGICMGGGVGIASHASHRLVTERTVMAMPECIIGLVPDVGSSLILARAPGRLGEYLGLTGRRMTAADSIFAGFADHYVEADGLDKIIDRLCDTGFASAVPGLTGTPPASPLSDEQARMDPLFLGEDAVAICAALAGADDSDEASADALKAIRAASPLSVAATLANIRTVRADPTIETALSLEYRFTHRSQSMGDHIEGVRAALIDRDKAPVWPDADLESLPAARLEAMRAPLGEAEWSPG